MDLAHPSTGKTCIATEAKFHKHRCVLTNESLFGVFSSTCANVQPLWTPWRLYFLRVLLAASTHEVVEKAGCSNKHSSKAPNNSKGGRLAGDFEALTKSNWSPGDSTEETRKKAVPFDVRKKRENPFLSSQTLGSGSYPTTCPPPFSQGCVSNIRPLQPPGSGGHSRDL